MRRCTRCGHERPWLHRHHIIPRSQGGSDDPINLLVLCANCHEDVHGGPCGGGMRGHLATTPEAQAKKSASLKALWQDPVWRENQLASRRASWQGEKGDARRVKTSESRKRWYAEHPEAAAERARKLGETRTGRHYPKLSASLRRRSR